MKMSKEKIEPKEDCKINNALKRAKNITRTFRNGYTNPRKLRDPAWHLCHIVEELTCITEIIIEEKLKEKLEKENINK